MRKTARPVLSMVLLSAVLASCTTNATDTPSSPSVPTGTPSAPVTPTPTQGSCTIEGTRKDDRLTGSDADDVICGRGGDDHIRAGGGDDIIEGGPGNDTLAAGAGDDKLDGGEGTDTADLSAAPAGVTVDLRTGTASGDGTDALTSVEALVGSSHDDSFIGTAATESFDTGAGDDRVKALGGDDTIRGGKGTDTLLGDRGVDTCLQGPGRGKVACERWLVPVPFARVGDLTLMEPAVDPILIAYHESLFRSAAAMKPLGDKADWMIQPSRGRPTQPTSAVDIPMEPKAPVVSPVDGTVIDIIEYSLYCEAQDTLVVIRPVDARDVTVVVMHLVEVTVRKGQPVYAGGTVLGEPHIFIGGNNQVTAYVPGSPPHVHIEVESDGSKVVPGCDYKREAEAKR